MSIHLIKYCQRNNFWTAGASIGGLFIQFYVEGDDKVRSADDIEKRSIELFQYWLVNGENKELAKLNGGRKHHETR